jgi:hypothetical protein
MAPFEGFTHSFRSIRLHTVVAAVAAENFLVHRAEARRRQPKGKRSSVELSIQ